MTARFKLVPPPPDDLSVVRDAQRAVPLVPGAETDCCVRLEGALDLSHRDVARTWLTFLRALGLVRETDRGFVRTRTQPDAETVATGLIEGVFGARETLDALDRGPVTVDQAFEAIEDRIPRWEREKDHAWRDTWRTRVEYLLGWLDLAGLVRRDAEGYVIA